MSWWHFLGTHSLKSLAVGPNEAVPGTCGWPESVSQPSRFPRREGEGVWRMEWAVQTSVCGTPHVQTKGPENRLHFPFSIQMFSFWVAKNLEQPNSWARYKPLPFPTFSSALFQNSVQIKKSMKRDSSANTKHMSPRTRSEWKQIPCFCQVNVVKYINMQI